MKTVPPQDLFDDESAPPRSNVLSIDDFVARAAKRAADEKRRAAARKHLDLAVIRAEMDDFAQRSDWSAATGLHLVALYCWLHEQVYGVAPTLDERDWRSASQSADRLVADQFAGQHGACVDFMGWTWKREQQSEKWRRDNHRDGGHVGWRLQFGTMLLDRYRVDSARTSAR